MKFIYIRWYNAHYYVNLNDVEKIRFLNGETSKCNITLFSGESFILQSKIGVKLEDSFHEFMTSAAIVLDDFLEDYETEEKT